MNYSDSNSKVGNPIVYLKCNSIKSGVLFRSMENVLEKHRNMGCSEVHYTHQDKMSVLIYKKSIGAAHTHMTAQCATDSVNSVS